MEICSVSTSVPAAAMPAAEYDDGYAFVSFHSCTAPPSALHAISVTSLTVSVFAPFWAILEIHFHSSALSSTPRERVTSPNVAWTPVGSGLGLPCSSQTLNSLACRLIDGSEQDIFLSKASVSMAVAGAKGPLAAPAPLVDESSVVPGYLMTAPSSYLQVFTVPALAAGARSVTLTLTYELLAQSAPKSKTYSKQTASNELVIPIQP